MKAPDLGSIITAWAEQSPEVSGLVLIGSRERPASERLEVADPYSDWDFQVITPHPGFFAQPDWARALPGAKLQAYAFRTAVIGGVPKVNAVFAGAEADFVIIPEEVAQKLLDAARLGQHREEGVTRRRLQDLAEVVRPGWRFLTGGEKWKELYQLAVDGVTDPHLEDAGARALAEGFVCDYVWTLRKIARGELRTAQRMIFRDLWEVNLQLLHELKRRRGQRTFTKARRIEQVATKAELAAISLEPRLKAASLAEALEKSAATCRRLMQGLVGKTWRWPSVK
jgi:hypothetical protein